jgi:hypothetical protein
MVGYWRGPEWVTVSSYPVLSMACAERDRLNGLGIVQPAEAAPVKAPKTLRDEFAMAALTGLLASGSTSPADFPHKISTWAYAQADAMLKERSK